MTTYRLKLGRAYIVTDAAELRRINPLAPGRFAWSVNPVIAATFAGRKLAEQAAREIDSFISAVAGRTLKLKIVPATGGVAITRKAAI